MLGAYKEIGQIEPSSAVLLLGSGFSLESTNVKGKAPPNGSELRKHFIKELNLDEQTNYDLQVLTEEFAEKDSEKLYKELYSIFRISSLSGNQKKILSENWLRIYTTNYDDGVETAYHNSGLEPKSYDIGDRVPNKLPKGSIIHLHGSIRAVTTKNVLESLVLGEKSYVRQYVSKSPWYNQFQSDIKFCSNLFVVGYSLSDYHIAALLLENPEIAAKTYFIQGREEDPIYVRRTSEYGKTLFIGLEGFSTGVKNLPRPEPIDDIAKLKSFKPLDPLKDQKSLKPPTANEVFELLVFGSFNYARCASTLSTHDYAISRRSAVDQFLKDIVNNKTVIVDGRLGNGKTVFLYMVSAHLISMGYTCVQYKEYGPNIDQEIELLKNIPKLVIFFEQYALAQDVLLKLHSDLPQAKFVVEIRTAIFEVRYHELSQNIPRPFSKLSVNQLSPEDVSAFIDLCEGAGIGAGRFGIISSKHELRDILLSIFDSENIKNKINLSIGPVFATVSRRKVLVLTAMLSNFHIASDPSFIKSVTGIDPFREFADIKEISDEIFDSGVERFQVRSSVFSQYAINNLVDTKEIIDCIVDTSLASAERKSDRQYRVLMSNMLQYSNIHSIIGARLGVEQIIAGVYERLRHDERVNDEPLFWLQYAIAMVDAQNLPAAQEFINTAYVKATTRTGFQTHQIDTQSFRILLLSEGEAQSGKPVDRIQEILDKLELLNLMLNEESHRSYAIKVLDGVYPFVVKRGGDLTGTESSAFNYWLVKLQETLFRLPEDFRVVSDAERIRLSIEKTKGLLV